MRFEGELSSREEERQWTVVAGWVCNGWYE